MNRTAHFLGHVCALLSFLQVYFQALDLEVILELFLGADFSLTQELWSPLSPLREHPGCEQWGVILGALPDTDERNSVFIPSRFGLSLCVGRG